MCACVCVCNICMDVKPLLFLFSLFLAGGSSTIASLLPTKTLAIGGDTRPGQSGVPALFDFSTWQGAKPRTPTTKKGVFSSLWQRAKPSTLQELCFYLELIRFLHHGRGLSREPYNDYSLQFVIYLLSFRSSLSFWSTSHWSANSSRITVSLSNLHVKGLSS